VSGATLDLTRKLIAVDTCDPHGNETEAALIVVQALAGTGIPVIIEEIAPGRANLIARIKGSGEKPGLALSAHFDTIGVDRNAWSRDPFAGEIENNRLYGRGAADMKGGMAAMTMAAITLAKSRAALKGDLVLTFSAAENSSCLGAKNLVEAGRFKGIGALLVSEPSSNRVLVSEKGALWIKATASGDTGHAAFREGEAGDRGNAILRLARFLDRIQSVDLKAPPHRHLKSPTINVGKIAGGFSTPMTPPSASAEIDVRTVPGLSPEQVLAAFRATAGAHIMLELLDFKPPVDTPDDHPFVQACIAACDEQHAPGGVAYYSDGAVIAPQLGLPMAIIGPGAIGMSGAVDEWVDIEKLLASEAIFTRVARSVLG
jgi:succinyl-diaminopimelate desuccinylase